MPQKHKKKRKPVWFSEEDFEVKPSSIQGIGMGLFACKRLRKGDIVGHYTGRRLTDHQANNEPYVHSRYLVWICKDWYIDGQGPEGNYTRFINHSEKPNAELVTSSRWKTAKIRALKRIEPGEEIFFNYGEEYWDVLEEEVK